MILPAYTIIHTHAHTVMPNVLYSNDDCGNNGRVAGTIASTSWIAITELDFPTPQRPLPQTLPLARALNNRPTARNTPRPSGALESQSTAADVDSRHRCRRRTVGVAAAAAAASGVRVARGNVRRCRGSARRRFRTHTQNFNRARMGTYSHLVKRTPTHTRFVWNY